MNKGFTLLAVALMFCLPAQAKEISLSDAESMAASVTPAASSPALDAQLAETKPSSLRVDKAWLEASGYDFQTSERQKRGIALLSSFSSLSPSVLQQSLQTVTQINHDATKAMQHQALLDAEGIDALYFLSDALGPTLGRAFIAAYDRGELSKAVALIKASEVSTHKAKKYFNYDRPFLVKGNTIHLVPDDIVEKDNKPYTASGGSFPSGHTNAGVTDALLLAQMIPERYDALLIRGARYGYSRLVLGVHYPLDVIGSRMLAQSNVAAYLNDAKYRTLFNEARDQLRAALEQACGMSLARCADTQDHDDPYRSAEMNTFYIFTLTYDLPRQTGEPQTLTVPQGAEVLLESALPNLSAEQRRALMVKTALPAGYPLSGSTPEQQFWQRLDLVAALKAAGQP